MTHLEVMSEKIRQHEERIKIAEKHLEIANSEMGDVRTSLNEVRTDVCWLKKFFWIIATSSIGGLVTGVMNLLLRIN
jgi:hypothetical protein